MNFKFDFNDTNGRLSDDEDYEYLEDIIKDISDAKESGQKDSPDVSLDDIVEAATDEADPSIKKAPRALENDSDEAMTSDTINNNSNDEKARISDTTAGDDQIYIAAEDRIFSAPHFCNYSKIRA